MPTTIAGLDRTARIEANIAAIRLARQLEEEDRAASPEELAVLDRFTGWAVSRRSSSTRLTDRMRKFMLTRK